jgi:hypothetical protein
VAEHAIFVYSAHGDLPDWRPFFTELEERRTRLLARAGETLETLKQDYPFLGVADLLSLSFCHGWTEPKARFGRSVHCEAAAVVMKPSWLPAAPVPVRVRARVVPNRAFASREAARQALSAAPVEFLTGVARGGSAS